MSRTGSILGSVGEDTDVGSDTVIVIRLEEV